MRREEIRSSKDEEQIDRNREEWFGPRLTAGTLYLWRRIEILFRPVHNMTCSTDIYVNSRSQAEMLQQSCTQLLVRRKRMKFSSAD